MVGHQAVGVYSAAELLFEKSKVFPVIVIIVVGSKNSLTVMSSLNNVMRRMRKYDSG